MPEEKRITIGFSTHRPEVVPLAAAAMKQHEAIVLEEPPHPGFTPMLKGELGIDDYLLQCDFEFPEFARQSAILYRQLYLHGKQLLQCDPYLARLNEVRELFEQGGRPDDIEPDGLLAPVFACERRCMAALLAYYEKSLRAPFAGVVELVKRFAWEDAARIRLRDHLRAEAIEALAAPFQKLYIEAGSLHLRLFNELRHRLGADYHLTPLYLTAPVVRGISGRHHARGPGEKLTLLYLYRPQFSGQRADLLAARTLIHSKVAQKEELLDTGSAFPHTRDDIESSLLVDRLSYEDCRLLYDTIKVANTKAARGTVKSYLERGRL
jgi:hypothetical protein